MSDIMGAGFYPHDPLPGPLAPRWNHGPPWDWVEVNGVRMPRFAAHILDYTPKPSPILEPPMYFPGAGWQAEAVYAG